MFIIAPYYFQWIKKIFFTKLYVTRGLVIRQPLYLLDSFLVRRQSTLQPVQDGMDEAKESEDRAGTSSRSWMVMVHCRLHVVRRDGMIRHRCSGYGPLKIDDGCILPWWWSTVMMELVGMVVSISDGRKVSLSSGCPDSGLVGSGGDSMVEAHFLRSAEGKNVMLPKNDVLTPRRCEVWSWWW